MLNMNRKLLFWTLLGTIIGGNLYALVAWNIVKKNIKKEEGFLEAYIALTLFGCITGSLWGFQISKNCYANNNNHDEAYREFFEDQQIDQNSTNLSNETTPLLQEHIVDINNVENLPNTINQVNFNNCIIL